MAKTKLKGTIIGFDRAELEVTIKLNQPPKLLPIGQEAELIINA